jgi:hypothetical protein
MSVLHPFIQKNWETSSEQFRQLASLYMILSLCHRERGGDDRNEKERLFAQKSLESGLKTENNAVIARCYYFCGNIEFKRGDVAQAHEYLYQAIAHFDEGEEYTMSSQMLYIIAASFSEIKDTDGMQRVLQQMEEYLKKDTSKQSLYQYNVIKHSYFDLLLEKEKKERKTVDNQLVDSIKIYVRNNINLVENHLDELSISWMHGYAYYYLAKAFDDYYPEQTDTIFLYLDKAIEMMYRETFSMMNESNAAMEFRIYIYTVRSNALLREGKIQEAYNAMSKALALIDELTNYKNLSELRFKAYQFMANHYESINRPAEALKFQKLLRESEAQRYETEKIQALNEMSIRYETEKKEIQIQTLIRENINARRILWLIAGLSLTMLSTSLLIILFGRLKRKNVEQQLYETALLAELRLNELEKIQKLQQQLEQNPVKNTIEQITWMIESSIIEKDTKKEYLERLSKIDAKLLENAYHKSEVKITGMDMKYIVCFAANIDTKDISLLFNIEPKSVNTVRYRIKKKFAKDEAFRMIL